MGCVHMYCGDGKGKTTAALGLSLRAAGRGYRVVIARFLKTDDSGEVSMLSTIPGVCVLPCEKTFGFYHNMTEMEKSEAASYYSALLERAWKKAMETEEGPVLLVLDEIAASCNHGLVNSWRVAELLDRRPEHLEVVLTGRDPAKELLDRADYISEIRKVRHPFDQGIGARKGIEY